MSSVDRSRTTLQNNPTPEHPTPIEVSIPLHSMGPVWRPAVSLVEAIHGFAPPGRMATMLQEGFTIVAWVALWRPVELLLYDQWPIRSDIALLRRIESAEVHVAAATPIANYTRRPAS